MTLQKKNTFTPKTIAALLGISLMVGTALPARSQTPPPIPSAIPEAPMPEAPIPQATAGARLQHGQEQQHNTQPDRYDLGRYPLTAANEAHWRSVLWATALQEPDHEAVANALDYFLSLTLKPQLSDPETRLVQMALQVSYQFYGRSDRWWQRLQPQWIAILHNSPNPRWVAMALSALTQVAPPQDSAADPKTLALMQQGWVQAVQNRLPDFAPNSAQAKNPKDAKTLQAQADRLVLTLTLRNFWQKEEPIPDLGAWWNWHIAPGEPQLFVLCAPGRSQLCRTALQDGQGQWLRQSGDPQHLWSIPLSGRSLHGLPWYLERGATPQGVYRLEGLTPQPDTDYFYAYGFFSLVNLFVPHEEGVKSFDGQHPGTIETLAAYQNLLPPAWRSDLRAQESYWAGLVGRGLFRIHGTGEAPNFFVNTDRFPEMKGWNPAIGCLSALETYDDGGQLLRADMPALLNALQIVQPPQKSEPTGYVIVLDVPDPGAVLQQLETN